MVSSALNARIVSSFRHPPRPPRPTSGDHRLHPACDGRGRLQRGAAGYGTVQPAVGRERGFIERYNGGPDRRDLLVTTHLLCDSRHRGVAVRADDSRCGYPAVEHPSLGQPLGVPAHDDDFDGAACCQQRRPQPGMLPKSAGRFASPPPVGRTRTSPARRRAPAAAGGRSAGGGIRPCRRAPGPATLPSAHPRP